MVLTVRRTVWYSVRHEDWIKGSVYGGGENGHNYQNGHVTVHSGTIGITDSSVDGGARYSTRGNVYGGGCGTDTFDRGEGDDKKTYYDFMILLFPPIYSGAVTPRSSTFVNP